MSDKISKKHLIKFTLNGKKIEDEIDSRLLLSDYIRDYLGQTGTHVGCEHGICGACTIHINGRASRSCLTLAVQADGCNINTIESISNNDKNLSIIQKNFKKYFALQCGFCTPGIIMTLSDYLYRNKDASEKDIKNILSGHLCRCTGYQPIIKAAIESAKEINDE
jgi:2-furoyl-CoA dehydrogenase 2Fe-2S iron sulfur subunit